MDEHEERRLERALARIEHALAELLTESKRENRLLWLLLEEERKPPPGKGAGFVALTGITVTAAP